MVYIQRAHAYSIYGNRIMDDETGRLELDFGKQKQVAEMACGT